MAGDRLTNSFEDRYGEHLHIGDRVKTDYGEGLVWGLHREWEGTPTADIHLMNAETIKIPCGCLIKTEP